MGSSKLLKQLRNLISSNFLTGILIGALSVTLLFRTIAPTKPLDVSRTPIGNCRCEHQPGDRHDHGGDGSSEDNHPPPENYKPDNETERKREHFNMVIKHTHDDSTRVSKLLHNEVRVFCWIMTSVNNTKRKAIPMNDTWVPRCNRYLFISSAEDSGLPTVKLNITEGRKYLWMKTKEAFRYLYHNFLNDYDWFLKVDDDTFVIVENLRFMLLAYSPKDPIYFGCRFKKYSPEGYMSGGAGYVLSREALRRFVEESVDDPENCKQEDTGAEDAEMGKCLQNVGVIAGDSRDSKNRHRMLPFGPATHLDHFDGLPNWFWDFIAYNYTQGDECCSDHMISFHYVNPASMRSYNFFVYHLRPYGLNIVHDQIDDNQDTMDDQQLLDAIKRKASEHFHPFK